MKRENDYIKAQIEESWREKLTSELESSYFKSLQKELLKRKEYGKIIFPYENLIFNAFNSTHFNKVKVVIIGQDPYHRYGQAHGLSFSVPKGIKKPPSLLNIAKEIKRDLNIDYSRNGDLSNWAAQGVLLLNSILTVEENNPSSHKNLGWEKFTDATIKKLSLCKPNLTFLLWGKFAIKKAKLIDENKHYILTASHPSPFSAHKSFIGCKHFSKTNKILLKNGQKEIDWQI